MFPASEPPLCPPSFLGWRWWRSFNPIAPVNSYWNSTEVIQSFVLPRFDKLKPEQREKIDKLEPNVLPAIASLRKVQCLGQSAIHAACRAFQRCYPRFRFIESFLFPSQQVNEKAVQAAIHEAKTEHHYLAIPLVIRRPALDHVVIIAFDFMHGEMEFYDPKGVCVNDQPDISVLAGDNARLKQIFTRLWQLEGSCMPVFENSACHQVDMHNCAIYALEYLQRRMQNMPAREICRGTVNLHQANQLSRSQLIEIIWTECIRRHLPPSRSPSEGTLHSLSDSQTASE